LPEETRRGIRAWLARLVRICIRLPPEGIDDLRIWRHRQLSTSLPFPTLSWSDDNDAEASLKELHDYAVQLAHSVIDWYIRHRFWKKIYSRALRAASFLLVIAAALVSLLKIFSSDLELKILKSIGWFDVHDPAGFAAEAALVLLGAAGGFNLIDHLASLSTGWMRYVSTAMVLDKELVKFHFEWARLERKVQVKSAAAAAAQAAGNQAPSLPGQQAALAARPPESDADPCVPSVKRIAVKIEYDGNRPSREIVLKDESRADLTLQRIDLVQEFCSTIFMIVGEETGVWADELKKNITKFTQDVVSHHGRDAGRA
jgi:hypothetical protein